MSTNRHIDKICVSCLCVVLATALLLVNAQSLGIQPVSAEIGYEARLFDTSKVHTIDIQMDEWGSFIDTCENEEYSECAVIIDGEAYKNVGIRAKGNTSLSAVSRYGNDRYSFKVEFDCYDEAKTYHGLDKISLNNMIQDNTYMKDYLCYQMMNDFGVASPLCSYAYLTVNGEDWGLYLAVEAVEESFLSRNYGKNYGELYKPDSMDMGGGRGNGGRFDAEEFADRKADTGGIEKDSETGEDGKAEKNGKAEKDSKASEDSKTEENSKEAENQGSGESQVPEIGAGSMPEGAGEFPEGVQPPGGAGEMPGGVQLPEGGEIPGGTQPPGGGRELPEGVQPPGSAGEFPGAGELPEEAEELPEPGEFPGGTEELPGTGEFPGGTEELLEPGELPEGAGKVPGPGMLPESSDVSLIYTDDSYENYKNIFENAKTDITDADKDRLIASLKKLNQGGNLEDVVDADQVIRYFVVHNFVCNFDSYTGSMIHNYYLYEKDGKMSMIPWDYNLAFGSFEEGADAESLINDPIDDPVSGGETSSRPMLAWIFEDEEYEKLYHTYFEEFIEAYFGDGYFSDMIDSVSEMIAPYVEKDPTKFCTYEEFQKGVSTLEAFCLLRGQSISGQLNGSIPSTEEGQKEDSSGLVEAQEIVISDMGSMGHWLP